MSVASLHNAARGTHPPGRKKGLLALRQASGSTVGSTAMCTESAHPAGTGERREGHLRVPTPTRLRKSYGCETTSIARARFAPFKEGRAALPPGLVTERLKAPCKFLNNQVLSSPCRTHTLQGTENAVQGAVRNTGLTCKSKSARCGHCRLGSD